MKNTILWFLAIAALLLIYKHLPVPQPDEIRMTQLWLGRAVKSELSNVTALQIALKHLITLFSQITNGLLFQTLIQLLIAISGYKLVKSLQNL